MKKLLTPALLTALLLSSAIGCEEELNQQKCLQGIVTGRICDWTQIELSEESMAYVNEHLLLDLEGEVISVALLPANLENGTTLFFTAENYLGNENRYPPICEIASLDGPFVGAITFSTNSCPSNRSTEDN